MCVTDDIPNTWDNFFVYFTEHCSSNNGSNDEWLQINLMTCDPTCQENTSSTSTLKCGNVSDSKTKEICLVFSYVTVTYLLRQLQ